jgi:predicted ATP-dependent protease
MNLTYSVSLEPEAIPLDVKIVLLGSRYVYHLLRQYDPDFGDLFKVVADFDDDVDWDDEHLKEYTELIAKIVGDTKIRHLDAGAVGRVLEYSSRLVEDRERLSTHICDIRDLLQEADFVAGQGGTDLIGRDHVEEAIDKRIYRLDRFRELVRENVTRGLILVDTTGARVGQINGLSVLKMGQIQFGQPTRITATARLGRGELIDIERESHLGGNIHSKAVMIVSSFLGSRYAKEQPLSLHASLVFEQSYGGIEGDSASIAEVCALLSAIIDRPIKQCLAVTGSMDQHGTTQAIGGVNEKIEGFFDICSAMGLSGEQGVIIPASNREHLMLRQDVVDAVAEGSFHVYTMSTVDDAIELLFAPQGQPRVDPQEIDRAVRQRVAELHEIRRRAAKSDEEEDGGRDK